MSSPSKQSLLCGSLLVALTAATAAACDAFWPIAVIACGYGAWMLRGATRSGEEGGWVVGGVRSLPLLALIPLAVSLAMSLWSEPIRLWLLAVLCGEAVLLWVRSTQRTNPLLGILLAVHVLSLSLEEDFPYYPVLALVAAATLVVFWLGIFSSAFAARSGDARVMRGKEWSPVRASAQTEEAGATPARLTGIVVFVSIGIGLLLFFFFPRLRLQFAVGEEDLDDSITVVGGRSDRVETSLVHKSPSRREAEIGYTETVSLKRRGPGQQDASQVMTVTCKDNTGSPLALEALYLRGSTLDLYDGSTWLRGSRRTRVKDDWDGRDGWIGIPRRKRPPGDPVHQEIRMQPVISNVAFGIPVITRIEADQVMVDVDDGCVRFITPATDGARSYRVVSRWITRDAVRGKSFADVPVKGSVLQVPSKLKSVADLARNITVGATSRLDKVEAIESYLRANLSYSLTVDYTDSEDPIREFLFARKTGYCVHFASGMIALLRAVAVPSRMACGFATSEMEEGALGTYVVRRRNAHSWVEVHFGEWGWVPFDPSPIQTADLFAGVVSPIERVKSWMRYISSFDEVERQRLVDAMRRFAPPWLWGVLLTIAVLWILVRRGTPERVGRTPKRRSGISTTVSFYDGFIDLLAREGIRKRPSSTPWELAVSAKTIFPADSVDRITRLFCDARYGERELTAEETDHALGMVRSLKPGSSTTAT